MAGSRLLVDRRLRLPDRDLFAAGLVGLAALTVLRTTMLPTVGSWDTAEAQAVLPLMGTMHPTGFPAYVLLGWLASVLLAPLGSPAFLMNLLSALLVAVATGGTVVLSRRVGATLPLAVAVGAGFALTPVVWSIGNAADAHALHLALVVALVIALLRWEGMAARRAADPADRALARRTDRAIVLAAAVFGIALANHALSLLLVPAIGLFVLAVEPRVLGRRRLVTAALAACLGLAALLYLELPLRAGPFRAPLVYGHPETWSGFWEVVLARQFQGDVVGFLADPVSRAGALVALAVEQFGPLTPLVPVGLLVAARRHPRYALLSGVAVGVTVLFAASYVNARIERYYLGPVLFGWTWIAILGAAVVDRVAGRAGADEPVGVPAWRTPRTALSLMLGAALLVPTLIALPERWREQDRSRETWVETWLDEALTAMAPDAVVASWWSYSTPLWYAQLVEGRRPDVLIVDDRTLLDMGLDKVEDVFDAYLGTRPVYLIRMEQSEVQDLTRRYTIEPVGRPGNLYRVTSRRETTP